MTSKAYANAVDASAQQGGRRNFIINGAMQVAQRGTSATGITSNGYYTVDRWVSQTSGATNNMSQEELTVGQTDLPSQFRYFLRNAVTTGNNYAGVLQAIEDVRTVSNETVTVSFYAKGTNPGGGDVDVRVRQWFGVGGSTQVDLFETIVLTSNWTRYELQFDLPSIAGKTIADGNYIQLAFIQPAGDNSTDAWTLDITGVQLEVGSVATPFEHRSYGEELALCQRYYQSSYNTGVSPGSSVDEFAGSNGGQGVYHAFGTNVSGGVASSIGSFVTQMRTRPTVTVYDHSGNSGKITTFDSGSSPTANQSYNAVRQSQRQIIVRTYQSSIFGFEYLYEADAEL